MFITIGEIIKAQGIKGEIKVRPLTDDMQRFDKLKQVYINGLSYDIRLLRYSEQYVYLSLSGVRDRNDAERLVGKTVDIDRVHAVDLPENTFFIADMIGSKVFLDDGAFVGTVDYVYQNGAADVYEVKGDKNVMFPFLNCLIAEVDPDDKKIVLKKDEFIKVAVYED